MCLLYMLLLECETKGSENLSPTTNLADTRNSDVVGQRDQYFQNSKWIFTLYSLFEKFL